MNVLSEQMEARLKEIRRMIHRLDKESAKAPEGRLRVSTNRGSARFYRVKPGDDPAGTYLRLSEGELARRLAQKDYDRKVLAMLEKEERLLEKAVNYYRNAASGEYFAGPEELVWGGLTEARKKMVEPVEPDTAAYVRNWLSETYEKKSFGNMETEYITGSGIRVRSKTELIIAEMLEKRNIPFYYEKPLALPGQWIIHPDFTALNVRKRKTIFWEHLGMMDDTGYSAHALERIDNYILAGYYPGERVVFTYETSSRPIRTRILEKIIEAYLE